MVLPDSFEELRILKFFGVEGHVKKAPTIKLIMCHPPNSGWIKCNTDEAAKGYPGAVGYGGISGIVDPRLSVALHII